jgi:hypothetical protein
MPAKHVHATRAAQLAFDWYTEPLPPMSEKAVKPLEDKSVAPAGVKIEAADPPNMSVPSPYQLVQMLPWDFRTTFPEPLEAAIEAGTLHEDDVLFENLKALHDEHANHALTLLCDLDAVMEARRTGVDPATGRQPRTSRQRNALQKMFAEEPKRLEHAFEVLMDVYEDAFGSKAVSAFRKAIRARHGGVEVISEFPPTPRPLAEAVARGVFGTEEDGTAVNPAADEVQAILTDFTEALVEMPEGPEHTALLAKCAEDFGSTAADELDRWGKLKPLADQADQIDYDPWPPVALLPQG